MCSYPRSLVFHKEIQDWDFREIFMGLQEGGVKKSNTDQIRSPFSPSPLFLVRHCITELWGFFVLRLGARDFSPFSTWCFQYLMS